LRSADQYRRARHRKWRNWGSAFIVGDVERDSHFPLLPSVAMLRHC
jgi:hypothetical protein